MAVDTLMLMPTFSPTVNEYTAQLSNLDNREFDWEGSDDVVDIYIDRPNCQNAFPVLNEPKKIKFTDGAEYAVVPITVRYRESGSTITLSNTYTVTFIYPANIA